MIPSDDALLGRFHRVLVEEIRERRPEYLREPFTVAEIYQELIPYRTHRDRLGVEMNADYEHALLRLLAGEEGFLDLESEAARRELGAELRSQTPDTGLFRNFAAATVRLLEGGGGTGGGVEGPASEGARGVAEEAASLDGEVPVTAEGPPAPVAPVDDAAREAPGTPGSSAHTDPEETVDEERAGPEEEAAEGAAPEAESGEGAFQGATPSEDPPAVAATPTREETGGDEPTACPWCREHLPDRDDLRFCPFCGTSVDVVPCPECGEELESSWRFCVRCGTGVSG